MSCAAVAVAKAGQLTERVRLFEQEPVVKLELSHHGCDVVAKVVVNGDDFLNETTKTTKRTTTTTTRKRTMKTMMNEPFAWTRHQCRSMLW